LAYSFNADSDDSGFPILHVDCQETQKRMKLARSPGITE